MEPTPEEEARYKEFGRTFDAARKAPPPLIQKRLAERLGVDQTMISAWGRGKKLSRMTRGQVERIERALGPERLPAGTLQRILFGPPVAELPRQATPEGLVAEIRRLLAWWDETHAQPPSADAGLPGVQPLRVGGPRTRGTGTQGRKRQA